MNIAIIPAKKYSSRLPEKNKKLFYGKPMISYSIEAAKSSKNIETVVVSTDDPEIMQIAQESGAVCERLRPKRLCDDYTTTTDVVKFEIQDLLKKGIECEYVCELYATAPFITSQDIDDTYNLLADNKYAITAARLENNALRSFYIMPDNKAKMIKPEFMDVRTQDLPIIYRDAGKIYWGKYTTWLRHKFHFDKDVVINEIQYPKTIDIDEQSDWDQAWSAYGS